jgi:hypothetical protein
MAPTLPTQLQEKLDAYEALLDAQEYTPQLAHESDLRQMKLGQFSELTRDLMTPMAPGALSVLWQLANGQNGATANVQAKCCMYILDRVIGRDASDAADPMAKLIEELRGAAKVES